MSLKIPSRPVHIVTFLLLAFLCYQAHQLTRHLVGAVLCGGFGSMTFTVTITRQPCVLPTLVTLSGPLLTYGLAWSGILLLRSQRTRLFAYALIFASFSHLRWIQSLTGRGDELILAQQWFGITNRLIVAFIVFLIGLPPIIAAYRVIANRRRRLVFFSSWLLPLLILMILLFGNAMLFGLNGDQVQGASLLGIQVIVLITDLIVTGILMVLAVNILRSQQEE